MKAAKQIFEYLGLDTDCDKELLSSGAIDSVDIMSIVNVISNELKKDLPYTYLKACNFESFEAIDKMIKEMENGAI